MTNSCVSGEYFCGSNDFKKENLFGRFAGGGRGGCFLIFFNIFDLKKYEESLWAGLQGEAGGDVRFNSEGDAVSNDHDIYHALRYI